MDVWLRSVVWIEADDTKTKLFILLSSKTETTTSFPNFFGGVTDLRDPSHAPRVAPQSLGNNAVDSLSLDLWHI